MLNQSNGINCQWNHREPEKKHNIDTTKFNENMEMVKKLKLELEDTLITKKIEKFQRDEEQKSLYLAI